MRKFFSIDHNGLLIKELDYFWRKKCLASVLLVEAEGKIYGIFFDREMPMIEQGVKSSSCLIFVIDKYPNVYQHTDEKEIFYSFDFKEGIKIGNPG